MSKSQKMPQIELSELGKDQYPLLAGMVKEAVNANIQMLSLKDFLGEVKARAREELGVVDSDFNFLVKAGLDQYKVRRARDQFEERFSVAVDLGLVEDPDE